MRRGVNSRCERRDRTLLRLAGVPVALCCALVALPGSVVAQTFEGRVLEQRGERPVSTALVRLLDDEGGEVALSIADSAGFYRVSAGAPGVYRLEAARLGFHRVESPLLEAGSEDGVYPIDLLMTAAPVELPGFTVLTNRVPDEVADRQIQLMTGLSPRSLRVEPIRYERLLDHAERGHDLEAMMRWTNEAGIVTRSTTDGPCFQVRGRSCLPVYLNGAAISLEIVSVIPLDMLHTAVILYPNESAVYNAGAILLYTEGWVR